jgi:integrase
LADYQHILTLLYQQGSQMLTDKDCSKAAAGDKPVKLVDGAGLYLNVTPRGFKSWRLAYRNGSTQKVHNIGTFPDYSPARARLAAELFRKARASGQPVPLGGDTFEAATMNWHRLKSPEWTRLHAERVLSRIRRDAFPIIGSKRMSEITSADVLRVLRNAEARGARDITRRLRQGIEGIFVLAIAEGKATHNAALGLNQVLAKRPAVQHMPMLPLDRVGEFMAALRRYPTDDKLAGVAVEFLMRTAARTGEVRGALWSEIDERRALWTIPSERMKMNRPHVVPLSVQALRLLSSLPRQGEFVFPGKRRGTICENTMLFGIQKRLGFRTATSHGMRALFKTVCTEARLDRQAVERCLAHVEGSKVEQAYDASELLPQRREILQFYSDWLDRQESNSLADLLD